MDNPRWNTLIGSMVAFLGAGLSLSFIAYLSEPGTAPAETPASRFGLLVLLTVAVAFVVLSYFLFRARNWARRILVVVTVLAGIGLSITGISSAITLGTSFRTALSQIGICLAIIPLPFLAALCLRHPDVVRDFNKPSK